MGKKKALNEEQSRERLIGWAQQHGCENDLLKIFARYDDLLKGARNAEERQAIANFGLVDLHNFFTGGGGSVTYKETVLQEDPLARKKEPTIPRIILK
jgi:hypothetical protein